MSSNMQRVTNVRAFIAERGRKVKGPHAMSGLLTRMPWPYCTRCGLVALRNEPTRKALKEPCETWADDR